MFYPALVKEAIDAALNAQWDHAITVNLKILENNPKDLESLNRLARAYLEVGDFTKSKKTYKEVLTIDPYNVIAQKNIKKFQVLKVDDTNQRPRKPRTGSVLTTFIEEPGKTKIVTLTRIADPSTLVRLHCGQKIEFVQKSRGIIINTEDEDYLGRVPDDLAYSLHYFMQNGNEYEGFIKFVSQNSVTIFIRELKRDPKFASQPSFPTTTHPTTNTEVVDDHADNSDDDDDGEAEDAA